MRQDMLKNIVASKAQAPEHDSGEAVSVLVSCARVAVLLVTLLLAAPASADTSRQTLRVDGVKRSYLLRLPAPEVLQRGRVPLVLVLHGGGGDAANVEAMTGFSEKARQEGFIVVYPDGSGRFRSRLLTWNAGHCCGYAMQNRVDDVGFINALLDRLLRDYPIDPARVYATGISNGGMMSHRLGMVLSERLAAIAPVVATLFGDETPAPQAVSALMLNGALDRSVPHLGGPPGGRFADAWDGTPALPALAQASYWARTNACAATAPEQDLKSYARWQYECPGGRAVELYLLKDQGHAWPGGEKGNARADTPSTSFKATDVIWSFFKAHPK